MEYLSYTAQPYFQTVSNRLYFEKIGNGYLLQEIKQQNDLQLHERDGAIWLEGVDGKQQLCQLSQLHTLQDDEHLGPIAYQPKENRLYLTLQSEGKARIISVDQNNLDYVLLSTLTNVVVVDLSVSTRAAGQGFLLVNFGDLTTNTARSLLISETERMPVQLPGRVTHALWEGEDLICYTQTDTETVRWLYTPATGKSRLWR